MFLSAFKPKRLRSAFTYLFKTTTAKSAEFCLSFRKSTKSRYDDVDV